MAARIVYLVERLGVAPASVLGLTFTNKAASELETRVREALADLPVDVGDEVTVDTYHAFAADLVKAYGIRVGVEVDADLLSEAQQYQILLGILDSERFEHLSVRTAGATIRKTLELASACADHVVPPSGWSRRPGASSSGPTRASGCPTGCSRRPRSGSSWPAWSSATRPRSGGGAASTSATRWPRRSSWSKAIQSCSRSSAPGSSTSCSTSTRTPTSPSAG